MPAGESKKEWSKGLEENHIHEGEIFMTVSKNAEIVWRSKPEMVWFGGKARGIDLL